MNKLPVVLFHRISIEIKQYETFIHSNAGPAGIINVAASDGTE